jgi:ferredoxin
MFFDSRPKVDVHITQTDEHYACALDESLLKGMMRLGRKGIPVGCVNGGCGVCKVRITVGTVKSLGPISRAHVTIEEEAEGFTLACRSAPVEPVCLVVAGKMSKRFSKGLADSASDSEVSVGGGLNDRR